MASLRAAAEPSHPATRAAVLAVRALVCATAGEVAAHAGQPNGSVSVALRALVVIAQVARAETARGVEYSIVSPGFVRPFKSSA